MTHCEPVFGQDLHVYLHEVYIDFVGSKILTKAMQLFFFPEIFDGDY